MSQSTDPAADPVFAAIERHRVVYDHLGRVCSRADEVAAQEQGRVVTDLDRDIYKRAGDAEEAAFSELLDTVPLTTRGVFAFIKYLHPIFVGYEDMETAFETLAKSPVLTGIPAAAIGIGAVSTAALAAHHPDVTLIALGKELEALHVDWLTQPDSVEEDPTYERHWKIRSLINVMRAKTVEGLRIKARAAEMALDRDPEIDCQCTGSFIKLSKSLARDLLAAHI